MWYIVIWCVMCVNREGWGMMVHAAHCCMVCDVCELGRLGYDGTCGTLLHRV